MEGGVLAVAGVPVLPVLVAAACIAILFAAFVSPIRSISLQHRLQWWIQRRESGVVKRTPDAVASPAVLSSSASQRAIQKAAGLGRRARAAISLRRPR